MAAGSGTPPPAVRSVLQDVVWPAIPSPDGARILALQYQLDVIQWWPPDHIAKWQWEQLRVLVDHAYRTTPHYRRRFDEVGLSPGDLTGLEDFHRIPLLSRKDLQGGYEVLKSGEVPAAHGGLNTLLTSGSTGRSVAVDRTALCQLYWQANTIRDHLWHRRDFGRRLAVIRDAPLDEALPPRGSIARNWGPSTAPVVDTGESGLLNICGTSVDQQADWLRHFAPHYLLTYPNAAKAIALHCRRENLRLPSLMEIRTFGEVLDPECREVCRDVFGVEVVDAYSSQELGYIALQCPEGTHYHVAEETVRVEVLDDDGAPCRPGEVGRVVVTPLHNFAMPLLRYEVGDFAEVGEPCACGRGLAVLTRVLGRSRNLLVLPDGRRFWPALSTGEGLGDLPLELQFQIVQRTHTRLELRLLDERPLSAEEAKTMTVYLQRTLGYPFEVDIVYLEEIPRSPTGKYEDFMSDVAAAEAAAG